MAVFFGERPIDIYIECDASLAGWGASCGGQSANGRWSILEAHNHINYLELLAALYVRFTSLCAQLAGCSCETET